MVQLQGLKNYLLKDIPMGSPFPSRSQMGVVLGRHNVFMTVLGSHNVSITLEDYMRIMEHNKGGPVPIAKVYEWTHTNQIVDGMRLHDDEPKPWPNPKHHKIHEAYEEKKGQLFVGSCNSLDCGNDETSKEVLDQLWVEVQGGTKNGKISGVDSLILGTTPRKEVPTLYDMNFSPSLNPEVYSVIKKQVKDSMTKRIQSVLVEFAQHVAYSNGQLVKVPLLIFDDSDDDADVGGGDDDDQIDGDE